MSHVVVTGGTGFIGGHVVDRFLLAGWRVTLLVRDPARIAARHQGRVEALIGDLAAALPPLPACEAVVHAAADMHFGHDARAMAPVNVAGTERLLAAAKASPAPPRFVHVSSQAVYGFDRHYTDADEATPMRPSPHAYCETKRLAEEAVWRAGAAGLPVTVLRPGFVYGPGDVRTLPPVVDQLRKGKLNAHIDGGRFDTGCLHVENCAEGAFLAATRAEAPGEAFNLGDGRVLTIRQMVDDVSARLGVPAPAGNVPFGVAMAAGHVIEGAWRLLRRPGPPPLSPFLVAMLRRNSGFSIAKAQARLGYAPRRQWEESLDETLAWCDRALRGEPA